MRGNWSGLATRFKAKHGFKISGTVKLPIALLLFDLFRRWLFSFGLSLVWWRVKSHLWGFLLAAGVVVSAAELLGLMYVSTEFGFCSRSLAELCLLLSLLTLLVLRLFCRQYAVWLRDEWAYNLMVIDLVHFNLIQRSQDHDRLL